MPKPNVTLGVFSAVAVIFIWSGFIVFSRVGVATPMTVYDVAALRFIVAGALVLPFCRTWWPGHLPLKAIIVMALCGPGVLYSLLMFFGLREASAAYGGVFANGSLPMFTLLIAFLIMGEKPKKSALIAVTVIALGGALLGLQGVSAGGDNVAAGIALFLSASAVLSVYIVGVRRWRLTPTQALALVNLPNAAFFLPVWYFLLPSGLAETEPATILFHALFQGLGPGFLAVILFALAAMHLGPTPTAGFSAAVPAAAALLAMPVLAEYPGVFEWVGIVIVSAGLGLLIARP